jgi:hypothetical protein
MAKYLVIYQLKLELQQNYRFASCLKYSQFIKVILQYLSLGKSHFISSTVVIASTHRYDSFSTKGRARFSYRHSLQKLANRDEQPKTQSKHRKTQHIHLLELLPQSELTEERVGVRLLIVLSG